MIASFRHKGLKRLYEKGDRSGLRPDLVGKIRQILTALEAAEAPAELDLPTFRLHALAGNRKGTFSVTVRANWRITFRFRQGTAYEVDLEDYH
ncbi:MAG TPA: type II toxin-antitoxin system RelE/ParE family toxin [Blastocatellia bacterium]|jgi:proteic killer suppression protein|nr:type II toxin-antitoxin system RelE/ParE family toxin [Blastocatellia bacterium]